MSVVPGWYPDPYDSSRARYWDGARWTSDVVSRSELEGRREASTTPADATSAADATTPADAPTSADATTPEEPAATYADSTQPMAAVTEPVPTTAAASSSPYGDYSNAADPYGSYQQPGQPPGEPHDGGGERRSGMSVWKVIIIVLVIVALGVGAFFIFRALTDEDDPSESPTDGTSTESATDDGADPDPAPEGVFTASAGDCMSTSASEEIVDCDEPHDIEVVDTFQLEADQYPELTEIQDQANEICPVSAEEYLGEDFEDDATLAFLYPTESTWQMGDREVICQIVLDEETTGSVRGSQS